MCGAQPTPAVCGALGFASVRSGIPTKTPLAFSHFSGKLCSFWSVPLHVFNTRSSGSALCRTSSCSLGFYLVLGGCLVCLGLSFWPLVERFVSLCILGTCLEVFCIVVSIFGMHIRTSLLGIGVLLLVVFPRFRIVFLGGGGP